MNIGTEPGKFKGKDLETRWLIFRQAGVSRRADV
jgi:hypothetical protein